MALRYHRGAINWPYSRPLQPLQSCRQSTSTHVEQRPADLRQTRRDHWRDKWRVAAAAAKVVAVVSSTPSIDTAMDRRQRRICGLAEEEQGVGEQEAAVAAAKLCEQGHVDRSPLLRTEV